MTCPALLWVCHVYTRNKNCFQKIYCQHIQQHNLDSNFFKCYLLLNNASILQDDAHRYLELDILSISLLVFCNSDHIIKICLSAITDICKMHLIRVWTKPVFYFKGVWLFTEFIISKFQQLAARHLKSKIITKFGITSTQMHHRKKWKNTFLLNVCNTYIFTNKTKILCNFLFFV